MRESGMSLRQIADFLSAIGVPTKKRGKKWHPQMIKRILEIKGLPGVRERVQYKRVLKTQAVPSA